METYVNSFMHLSDTIDNDYMTYNNAWYIYTYEFYKSNKFKPKTMRYIKRENMTE